MVGRKIFRVLKKRLENYNINLEIIEVDTYKTFLKTYFIKKTFQFIGIEI